MNGQKSHYVYGILAEMSFLCSKSGHHQNRGGFRVQNKVVTNFYKIDTIYIKVMALIFVVIVVVIIIIVNATIFFCFEILVVVA